MRAWIISAALLALPALAFADAPSGAPSAEPLQQNAAKAEATAGVIVLHGNNSGKGIDAKLDKIDPHIKHKLGKPPFSAWNSYELLDQQALALARTSANYLKLPDGGELAIQLTGVDEKKGEPKRYAVKASIKKADGTEFLPGVEVRAKNGRWFFLAGYNHKNGILAIGIKIE